MSSPVRRPYTGSCHCKATRFIVYLSLPASAPDRASSGAGTQRFYRCNCTFCHKAGLMHVRVPDPARDFHLLSPLDPMGELGDYTCSYGKIHFLFCKTCGVRCFSWAGEGEVGEVDGLQGERVTAWHAKEESVEGHGEGKMYLSVNAHAIDAEQEGFDMKEWVDKKWLWYLDLLKDGRGQPPTSEGPPAGGCY